MGKDSAIEWTDHTFNPWWGCEKVSPACVNCYAEAWARRLGEELWGRQTARRVFSANHWRDPLRWNRHAEATGQRRRVFSASMADVFEARSELDEARAKLWTTIDATPALDWLLLTKRPENVKNMVPWSGRWPANVWLGTTAENQQYYEKRVLHLTDIPAAILFLSCEPLLGPVRLDRSVRTDWVIVGGESGSRARPMSPEWARTLRDQCEELEIPFFFKQWGEWRAVDGADAAEPFVRLGKKSAGRSLDGRIWNEVPQDRPAY